jgi:hypothetical protein
MAVRRAFAFDHEVNLHSVRCREVFVFNFVLSEDRARRQQAENN